MRGRRRCAGCGQAAPASARFCGRCGGLLDAPSRLGPADDDVAPIGRAGRAVRGGRWLGVAVVVVGVAGVAGAILAADRASEPAADDEVALPDEEELAEQQATTPSSSPSSGMPDPDDIELTCLVDEPCERWRVDVDWLAHDGPFMQVQQTADGGYVLHGPAGVVVLDRAGRERWRRDVGDGSMLDRALAVDHDVLAMTSDGALRLLDGADGSTRWRHDGTGVFGDERQLTGGGVHDEVVLLQLADTSQASDGPPPMTVVALDRDDGTRRWARSEDGEQALTVGGRVLVLADERLAGLEPATGEAAWVVDLPPPDGDAERVTGGDRHLVWPVFGGDRVTVVPGASSAGSPTRTLLFDPITGRRVAELEGRPLAGGATAAGVPLILDRTPVESEPEGGRRLLAVDAEGETVWERELERPELEGGRPTTRQTSVHDELLLYSSGWQHGEHAVQLVDLATGRTVHEGVWEIDEPVRPLGEGVVEVVREDAQTAVAVGDGAELWRLDGGPVPLWGPGDELLARVGDDVVALHADPREPGPRRPGGREAFGP